ncbi:MAG TPA: hypothetical protein VGL92_11775 [Acidimicrobiia bacterium]
MVEPGGPVVEVVSGPVVVVVAGSVVVVVGAVLEVVVVGPGVTVNVAVALEAFGLQGGGALPVHAVTTWSPGLAAAGTLKDAANPPLGLVVA